MEDGRVKDVRIREKKGVPPLTYNNQKTTEMKYLRIEKANYIGNLTVMLTFNDGADVTIDFGSWIAAHPHPQHDRYLDERKFKKFYIDDMGNIAWGKNRDLYFPIDQLRMGTLSPVNWPYAQVSP